MDGQRTYPEDQEPRWRQDSYRDEPYRVPEPRGAGNPSFNGFTERPDKTGDTGEHQWGNPYDGPPPAQYDDQPSWRTQEPTLLPTARPTSVPPQPGGPEPREEPRYHAQPIDRAALRREPPSNDQTGQMPPIDPDAGFGPAPDLGFRPAPGGADVAFGPGPGAPDLGFRPAPGGADVAFGPGPGGPGRPAGVFGPGQAPPGRPEPGFGPDGNFGPGQPHMPPAQVLSPVSSQPGTDGVYRTRRPAVALIVAVMTGLFLLGALRVLVDGLFGGPFVPGQTVAGMFLVAGLPVFALGLYGASGGGVRSEPGNWAKPPVLYLVAGLGLLIAAALAV